MVVGEGLFGALRLTLRAALKRVVSRCSTRTLIEGSHHSPRRTGSLGIIFGMVCNMRDGGGRRIIRRVAPHPAGRAEARCLAMLDPNLNRRFSSLSPQNRKLRYQSGMGCNIRDGGGRRIRTFEVCDGRFTVCSLWPLGNPTWDSDVA